VRLLQLDPEGPLPSGDPTPDDAVLDLHPRVSVVTGLSEAGRARVLRALTALSRGGDPGCAGLVEAHGVILDLDASTLALLGLDTDLDVVVRADDLPGRRPAAPEQVGPEQVGPAPRVDVEHVLAVTPEGRSPELDEARRAHRDARAALEVLREAAASSRRDLDAAIARRERAEATLDAVRRGADADATRVRLTAAERTAAVGEARGRLERIDRGLAELTALDLRPVEVLLEAIRNPHPVEYVASARAVELADQVASLRHKLGELEDRMEAEGRGPAKALERLEGARAAVHAAERALAKPDLSPEDVAELEAAHEEVLEAEQRSSGPFGRRSNQKRLDEALARQQGILDRVGFPTWSAYVMGAGLMSVDPMAEMNLEKARFALEAAEVEWAEVSAAIEANPRHRALLDELEAVYLEAYDLLEGREPDDLETALREVRVARQEVTTDELVEALAYQLEMVGLRLPEPVSADLATTAAEAFLAEAAGIGARVEELRAERREVERRLEELEHEQDRLLTAELDEGDPDRPDRLDVLEALEADLRGARDAEAKVTDALEARSTLVDAATQVEAVAAARVARIAVELATGPDGPGVGPMTDPAYELDDADLDGAAVHEAIEFYLLTRLAAQRTVSYAGSVPLVLDDALADVADADIRHLLTKLERMSEAVQIVHLSDDPRVSRWADEVGFARAAVVAAPPALA
jgi:hypothetical protein